MNNYHQLGGTVRARGINETLIWLADKLPKMGITRIANVTGLDSIGLHVVTSIRPNAKHLSVSQGKGVSLELAKISAIMESIEIYHTELPPPITLYGNYTHLKNSYSVINPNQFAQGAFCLNNLEDYDLDWVTARELLTGFTVYIPRILVCLDTTQPRLEYGVFNVTTNGLAAGNTTEEALCHALFELIERDNLSRLQAGEFDLKTCQLKLESVQDEINRNLLIKLQSRLKVAVWDITGNSEVPTFHAALEDLDDPVSGRVYTGSGTHFCKEIALSRALTEAAQARLTIITGARDDIFPEYYETSRLTAVNKSEKQQDSVFSDGQMNFQNCFQPEYAGTFSDNVKLLCKKLIDNNYKEIYWVEHTKQEINVPVVQVFVPRLQHDHSRK